MGLAAMIRTDAGALTCDFAEIYHVLDWRGLPMRLAATLAAGLREDSRIRMAQEDMRVSMDTLLLSTAVDMLTTIAWYLGGAGEKPAPLTPLLLGEDNEYTSLDADAFDAWRAGLLEG